MIPKRHIDRHVVRTDPRHHTITDPALTNPLPPIITHNNPHLSDFISAEKPCDSVVFDQFRIVIAVCQYQTGRTT